MTLHTAVIDAGSSGTRLFLYRVEPGSFARAEKLLEQEFPTMASVTPSQFLYQCS